VYTACGLIARLLPLLLDNSKTKDLIELRWDDPLALGINNTLFLFAFYRCQIVGRVWGSVAGRKADKKRDGTQDREKISHSHRASVEMFLVSEHSQTIIILLPQPCVNRPLASPKKRASVHPGPLHLPGNPVS
jgi:hypothetical protein